VSANLKLKLIASRSAINFFLYFFIFFTFATVYGENKDVYKISAAGMVKRHRMAYSIMASIQVGEIMRSDCRESGLMMEVHHLQ